MLNCLTEKDGYSVAEDFFKRSADEVEGIEDEAEADLVTIKNKV